MSNLVCEEGGHTSAHFGAVTEVRLGSQDNKEKPRVQIHFRYVANVS